MANLTRQEMFRFELMFDCRVTCGDTDCVRSTPSGGDTIICLRVQDPLDWLFHWQVQVRFGSTVFRRFSRCPSWRNGAGISAAEVALLCVSDPRRYGRVYFIHRPSPFQVDGIRLPEQPTPYSPHCKFLAAWSLILIWIPSLSIMS